MISKCKSCGTEFKHNPSQGGTYCSRQCQQDYQDRQYITEWLNGTKSGIIRGNALSGYVRRHLLEEAGYKCSQCGWSGVNPVSGKTTLEIDHIDGNRKNAKKENLRVLCPNCHSLTPTYRALNIKKLL
jgi:5-methylcytosine-specific restriction endonuclease McrA